MKIYMAGISSPRQEVPGAQSFFEGIKIRPGDVREPYWRDRGDYNRHKAAVDFIKSDCDALYLTDMDMKFHPNVLERLRAHDVPLVTGHYLKRKPLPPESVVGVSPDGTFPFFPLEIFPEDGLYSEIGGRTIITAGFGNVLIKREVLEAVIKSLPRGTQPLGMGPLPEMTNGDHGHFGADYLFYVQARRVGYPLLIDMHRECEPKHAATIWLNRDMYPLLRQYKPEKTLELWDRHYNLNRSIHGMNLKTMEAALERAKNQLELCRSKFRELKPQLDVLEKEELVWIGRVDALQQLINEEQELSASLPTYETEDELEAAIADRGKGPGGLDVDATTKMRQTIYNREAKEMVDAVDEAQSVEGD